VLKQQRKRLNYNVYLHNNITRNITNHACVYSAMHVGELISAVDVPTAKHNTRNTYNMHIMMFYSYTECNCTAEERTDIVFSCKLIININQYFLNAIYMFIMIKFNR